MYRRLKVFLRQQFDILTSLNFFDWFSFYRNSFKAKKKLEALLEIEHKQKDLWGSEQWKFFISDLQSNYLKENGKIILNFNEEEPGFYFSSELKSYFRQENYIIEDNTILIQSSPRG